MIASDAGEGTREGTRATDRAARTRQGSTVGIAGEADGPAVREQGLELRPQQRLDLHHWVVDGEQRALGAGRGAVEVEVDRLPPLLALHQEAVLEPRRLALV